MQTREDRLKAALRENLKRRKAQARGRTALDGSPEPPGLEPSRGGAPEGSREAPEEAAEGAAGPEASTE